MYGRLNCVSQQYILTKTEITLSGIGWNDPGNSRSWVCGWVGGWVGVRVPAVAAWPGGRLGLDRKNPAVAACTKLILAWTDDRN